MAAAALELPPGFRFHPTDEELVMHYLCRKCASQLIAVPIVAEIDLYKFDPWELPGKSLYGEKEWYFFSPRERKYPNGSRPNRAAGSGYWKATGADKPIGRPKPMGIKKALVFYTGKAPKGEKTNWIMHEYRLADVDRSSRKKNSLRLDDWVLCRIYNKKGTIEKRQAPQLSSSGLINQAEAVNSADTTVEEDVKPKIMAPPSFPSAADDYVYFDTSDSVPKLHTDSSCSEQQAVSPEFTCEVQSEPKWKEWTVGGEVNSLDFFDSYMDTNTVYNGFASQFEAGGNTNTQMSPLQDMFMYLQRPF